MTILFLYVQRVAVIRKSFINLVSVIIIAALLRMSTSCEWYMSLLRTLQMPPIF